jgi:hypothetical protein
LIYDCAMKTIKISAFLVCILLCFDALAQFENPENSVRFKNTNDDFNDPKGLKLPATKRPGLSDFDRNKKAVIGLNDKEEKLDISMDDGLLDYKTNTAPKAFQKDKEADEKYGKDQYLGDVRTGSAFVHVKYRDHEYVDGDRIRVFVNDDIVQSDISLGGSFHGFKLPLESGFNRVEFQALNQGTSGPNTAELHVYDEKGLLISAKEWNLLTGKKATIVIVKD